MKDKKVRCHDIKMRLTFLVAYRYRASFIMTNK
jgi:hypothetical protein